MDYNYHANTLGTWWSDQCNPVVASLLSSAGPCPPTSDLCGSNHCCCWPLQNPKSRPLRHLFEAASCVVAEIFSPSLRSSGAGHDGDGVWQFWPIWRFLWGRELCPPSSSWKIWSDWKKTWNSFKLFPFAYELVKSTKTILDWLTFRSSWWNLSDIPLILKLKRSEFFHSFLKVAAFHQENG